MLVYQRVNETMNIQLHPFLQLHSFRCPVRPRCRVASDQRVPPVAGPGGERHFLAMDFWRDRITAGFFASKISVFFSNI